MIAEIHAHAGFVRSVDVPPELVPEHVYCDTCGDCTVCDQHGPEDWCPTGGRWVLYAWDEDDAKLIAAL